MDVERYIKEAHKNAIEKGFYDCPECGGSGSAAPKNCHGCEYGPDHSYNPDACTSCKCQHCNGTGIDPNKNIGELLMLIVSELGEALEAHRKGWYHFNEIITVKKPEYEEWKIVPSFPDYEASSLGRIRSIDRGNVWNGKVDSHRDGKILKPGISGTGYYTVAINSKTQKVAWLVAEAFYGDRTGNVVNHKNGDKTCDWVTNIEYTDYSGNNLHAIKTGLTNRKKKLSIDDQFNIAFRFKKGETAPNIHSDYPNVSLSAIKNIRQKGIERFTDCFEMEIADVFIRLFDLCGYLGIEPDESVMRSFPSISKNIGECLLKLSYEISFLGRMVENYINPENYGFIFAYLREFCELYNIPIEKHIKAKMEYNKTRPAKHGKEY